jgi:hypothetical protein
MASRSTDQEFARALDGLVDQLREDRSVLAAILCGSLSHDRVWAGSDIDLVLVTADDRKGIEDGMTLNANGVNVHALLLPRAEFRKLVGSAVGNTFVHSFLTKGRLLYTHDESITDLCATLRDLGERDTQVQLLRAATFALPPIYKAHKFFVTRGDLEYTALWILFSAWSLARIEVVSARQVADREVLPQAMTMNPAFFRTVYTDLLNEKKTKDGVRAALDALDAYIAERTPVLFAPLIAYLRDAGEARSCREIEDHFRRHFDVEGVTTACEYLADRGILGKAAISVQLTRRSNVTVQELAFFLPASRTNGR